MNFADCDSGNSNKLVGNRKVREGKYSLKNVTLTTDKYFSGLGSHKKSCISFLFSDFRKQIFLCKQLKRLDFGVSLPGWMGKQHIRRQCCYVLFSDAESFSYNVFLLKSENTFCYTPKRIWIHVHLMPMLPVDRHRDLSDHCSYGCPWFCQHRGNKC